MSGYYLMHRGWMDNPAFNDEPYSRRDAWMWIIENANYADGRWSANGKTINLKRGQICRPLRKIAEAWQWDEAKVRRFLARLKNDAMLECVADAGVTVISVCNYDDYQFPARVGDAAPDARVTQDRRITDALTKEGNKDNSLFANAQREDAPAPLSAQVVSIAGAKPKSTTGTRLPSDWELPAEWRQWAIDTGLDPPTADREGEKFADYWRTKPGAGGRRTEWELVWRNWVRRALEYRHEHPPHAHRRETATEATDRRRTGLTAAVARRMGEP